MAPVKERKQNVLFDTLASLFNNKEYINGLTQESIKQNSFMINRRLAIMYPLQAQVFNNSKVNPVDVLHFWSDYLYNGKFPPRWIYTAGAAKSQAKKDDKKLLNYRLKGTKTSAEKRDSIAVQRKWNRLPEKEKAKYEV